MSNVVYGNITIPIFYKIENIVYVLVYNVSYFVTSIANPRMSTFLFIFYRENPLNFNTYFKGPRNKLSFVFPMLNKYSYTRI